MTTELSRFNQHQHKMDIQISSNSKLRLKSVVALLLLTAVLLVWWWMQPPRLKTDELLFAEVLHGTFQKKLQVSGQFKPLDSFWLVVPAEGVLTSLTVRPGSVLQPGQLLASITSHTLEQNIKKAQAAYAQAEAEYKAQQAQSEIDYSAAEIALLHAQHQAETSQMDMATNAPLLESGIVSRLQFEKLTKITLQNELILKAEQARLQSLKRLQQARLTAILVKNKQMAHELEELVLLQQRLQIRAAEAGVVTQLAENLMPGQTLVAGSPIIQFAGSNSLYTELYVPAMYANSLQHGLVVTLHLQSGSLQGVVNRIDPRVVNDRITVDVVLPQKLPSEARAELAVRASILLSEQPDSVFVQRPFYVQADELQSVFIQAADGQSIYKRDVKFGAVSGNQIEVISGIVPNDKLLLTELTSGMFQNSRIMLEPQS